MVLVEWVLASSDPSLVVVPVEWVLASFHPTLVVIPVECVLAWQVGMAARAPSALVVVPVEWGRQSMKTTKVNMPLAGEVQTLIGQQCSLRALRCVALGCVAQVFYGAVRALDAAAWHDDLRASVRRLRLGALAHQVLELRQAAGRHRPITLPRTA